MRFQQLRELKETEQRMREIWHESPERRLDEPHQREEVMDVLERAIPQGGRSMEEAFSRQVPEAAFIPDELDCAFVQHLRYTPAFWHEHEFFELLCVLSGSCENLFRGERLSLQPGDICIHAPGTVHAVGAFSDDAVLLNILIRRSTFDRSFFSLLEAESILSRFFHTAFRQSAPVPYLLFHTGSDLQIRSLILDAVDVYGQNRKYQRQLLNAMLSELLIRILQGYEDTLQVSPLWSRSPRQEQLMDILRYAQEHYQTVTMGELSARFHYSGRQLQRLFQQATGSSFRDAIQSQKLQRAAELLRTTDLPVQIIAEEVGFQAVNNFRKQFERRYGNVPSSYRKKQQEAE